MAVGAKTRGRRAGPASSLMVKRPGARRTGDADLPIAHWRLALRLVKVSARRLAGSGFLGEAVVNPIFMEVCDVVTEKASEVLFVQRNDVVQDLSPAAADPSFRDAILPGRLDARLPGLQTRCLQKGDDIAIEFRIAVEDDVTIWAGFGKRLPQLLHDPTRQSDGGSRCSAESCVAHAR